MMTLTQLFTAWCRFVWTDRHRCYNNS